jgi:hypothetical protein
LKKDGSVKLGKTKCDFCNGPAEAAIGQIIVCKDCALLAKTSSETATLKAAGLILRDLHK